MNDQLRHYLVRFAKLTDSEWIALEKHLYSKTIPKKSFLIQQGQTATQLGFLLSGSCRVFYEKDGQEKTTYFCFENELVAGYLSCITNQPSTLSIQALEDCQLVCFNYEVLTILYQQFPAYQLLGRKLAEFLLACLDIRLTEMLILSPRERYLHFISTPGHEKIIERIPLQYVASYLGITPVSLSRIRRRITAC